MRERTNLEALSRLYGLPKTHKPDFPIRPILSMCNSPTYELAKWLCDVLQPVRSAVGQNIVKDSFSFVDSISNMNLSDRFMVSFDVQSLFTNVPLRETTLFVKTIISDFDLSLPFSSDLLEDLILLCAENTKFQFQNKLYPQVNADFFPLGPVLADIFLGYLENYRLKDLIGDKTVAYFRFVDDIFCVLPDSISANDLLNSLNSTHPSLSFTLEFEKDRSLPFLDACLT